MIIAENITKAFDGTPVLRGVSLSVADGEFVSIMGKSGSGKSTLLSVLAGNLSPDGGSVLLDGEDICRVREKRLAELRRTKLAFVYQSLNLIPTLDARDNILLPLYLGKADISKNKQKLKQIADRLEISAVLSKFPREMSGGERQRVAIAKSLMHSPSIIMLDEPTGSLDSKNAQNVMQLLRELNRETGVSVLQVTHDREAASIGDRTVHLHDGRVVDT